MATKTEKDIAMTQAQIDSLESQLEQLQVKKTNEDAIRASETTNMLTLAVQIHTVMCTLTHGFGDTDCHWNSVEFSDDPAQADWAERDHALWLERARLGVGGMRAIGFIVTDPAEGQ